MKKIALLTFGLLLAATPAFAESVIDQYSSGNAVGDTLGNSYANSANEGVSTTDINNSSGIVNQNINTGASSNVGSSTDLQVTGGIAVTNSGTYAGSNSDSNQQLSLSSLVQVSSGNSIGNALGTISNSLSSNLGVTNVGLLNSQGIVSQNINVGASSNVGTSTAITIH